MSDPSRDELYQWDREFVWHPFTQMAEYEPLIIERAQGCTLVDIQGREYLDGVSSLWCNLHGHRHPRLDAALREQLDRVAHTTALGASNPTTIELAKRLVDLAPREPSRSTHAPREVGFPHAEREDYRAKGDPQGSALRHVYFSDNGSTAVEVALKMAFQYWRQCPKPRPEKTSYAALGEAYHGDTLGSVSVGGVERFHALFEPLLFPVVRVPSPQLYRLPPSVNRKSALEYYLEGVERMLAEHHEHLAAFVMEPLVQCAAGMIVHPPGYLRGVRELTRKYDVLLIADEVATGFGRTGKMFACEHEEVAPDFLCLAKGLTAGYLPLAATLTTHEVWQAFLGTYAESRTFFHGHTYCGNPLACAVALESLAVFEEERLLDQLQAKTARLTEHLSRISQHPHVGDVRQCGLIAGIELVRDRESKEAYPWTEKLGIQVCQRTRIEGVLLRPLGNVVVVMPPLAISHDELDRIARAIERGIEACT